VTSVSGTVVRTLVVWCPDWPVVAAGAPPGEAVAVVHANRVVACSAAARAEGVRRGLRRREAQGRCPGLTVLPVDVDGEARAFEAVAAAMDELTPRVEVVRPGTLAFPTRGPSRYHGGDVALAGLVAGLATGALPAGAPTARVGVADGPFAAGLAARRAGGAERVDAGGDRGGPPAGTSLVVAPGGSAAFLAPLPVATLDAAGVVDPDLTEVLRRLGLRTLGQVAELPAGDVLGRFGPAGERASRLARGLDDRPPALRTVPPELVTSMELDPPVDRVETAAFIARTLAAELAGRLAAQGLACTRVAVEAETDHDEVRSRLWRSEGGLGPDALADRVRWQLDGWLNGPWGARPTGGIRLLRLVPDQVVADDGRQLGFWGGAAAADERAARGVARLQGVLGPDAVTVAERRGGRGPGEQVVLVPAHTVALGARRTRPDPSADAPWPGHLPAPSPALVHVEPVAAEVLAADGEPVGVTGRGLVTAEPVRVRIGGRVDDVTAWAGPWPADERWWDPGAHRRRARIQVVLADGSAHLLSLEAGGWAVEASYD
jgi:protein ImuB